jgi:YebC/PmpR family DNA-binding regulatory protein
MGRIGNIIDRKNKQDQKRGKIFTKIGREISVAAREGGADPEYNAALKTAIEKGKASNMPNDTIDRAIKKGSGELDGNYEESIYEGYGPGGIAVLVETLSDNKNRTAPEVRSYFVKASGNLGTSGCVSYMFDRKGVIVIDKLDSIEEDELMMIALESGASDFTVEEDHFEVITEIADFTLVRDTLSNSGYSFSMAELRYLPQTFNKLSSEEDVKNMQKLIDLLEDNDDVQNVYHNWEE